MCKTSLDSGVLPAFLNASLDEMPIADGLQLETLNAELFPTRAGFPIGIVVTRDLDDPAAPVTVEMYVTLAPPSA